MKNIQVAELTALIKSALLGVAVGDALGVPVEFTTRDQRKLLPVKEIQWKWGAYAHFAPRLLYLEYANRRSIHMD